LYQVTSDYPPGMVVVVTGELTRYVQFHQCLNRLRVPAGSDLVWAAGGSVSRNINRGLTQVLREPTAQWAWMMGDDHTFPPDIVLDLLRHRVDCVVPVCAIRTPPFETCLLRNGKNVPLRDLPETGLYRLTGDETYGDAGMLLSRKAITATGPPWQDGPRSGTWTVEDRIFVEKLRTAGFDVHIALDSVLGHITPCEILPGRVRPTFRFAKKTYHADAA